MIFKHLRTAGGARAVCSRVAATCLVVLLTAVAVPAYTLVMRGGRRVEIPDTFRLTQTQLTYEAAPGFSVTVPLELVDIAATERANREPAGSFFRRASAAPQQARTDAARAVRESQPRRTPARALTNRELEGVRRKRVESELAYERRREELGLPSAEEMRRWEREQEEAMRERARQKREEDEESEEYWRERASLLRSEMGALDVEIGYLRRLLAEMSDTSSVGFSSGALAVISSSRPFFGRRGFPAAVRTAPFAPLHPANFGAFQTFGNLGAFQTFGGRRFTGTRVGASISIGGGTRARVGLVRRDVRRQFARRRFPRRFSPFFAPGLVGFAVPFNYQSADATVLLTRLQLLEAERAGLAEQWRQLEEEARRAGAPPGWLRP